MNPYETPHTELSDPIYDWILAKRIVMSVAVLGIWYSIILCLSLWHTFANASVNAGKPTLELLCDFFSTWGL